MKPAKNFVIDFDSTFTKVEAFDVLAEIALKDHAEKELIQNVQLWATVARLVQPARV